MSGQSASLSISEAKRMQERICAGGNDQGPKGSGSGLETIKKVKKGK